MPAAPKVVTAFTADALYSRVHDPCMSTTALPSTISDPWMNPLPTPSNSGGSLGPDPCALCMYTTPQKSIVPLKRSVPRFTTSRPGFAAELICQLALIVQFAFSMNTTGPLIAAGLDGQVPSGK